MGRALNWNKQRFVGRRFEPARPIEKEEIKGGWTHVKRNPVRHMSVEEYLAARSIEERSDPHA